MRRKPGQFRRRRVLLACFVLTALLLGPGCFLTRSPSRYYGRIVVPRDQEFRWSDGGLPQVFDPAFAAAPPDTDAVRALFEGLTDYDPQTLKPVPAVAVRWESSEEGRVWTFYLRNNARWSTGEPVTARDFVRSWQRILRLGDQAPHTDLLSNIQGAKISIPLAQVTGPTEPARPPSRSDAHSATGSREATANPAATRPFGAEAVNDYELRVHLERSNPYFPALVAHPVFRPVKVAAEDLKRIAAPELISNGAFSLATTAGDHVLLERAEHYWDKETVNLRHVEFVGTRDAESALAAYRTGDVDAVTNAAFEPLGLKLLAPYADYRRTTYGALTYYHFNTARRPFDDVRVREALALAIDRERISEDELGGATEPAQTFLPEAMSGQSTDAVVAKGASLEKDLTRAKQLLAEAGFPNGQGFPTIRLLINRNDQQRQVADAVASMWRANLGIQTEVIVRSWDEYEAAIRSGDYDLARRGLVMQTSDEFTNMSMLFGQEPKAAANAPPAQAAPATERPNTISATNPGLHEPRPPARNPIESEAEALRQLNAIPIYFASASALVKPYVSGFDTNLLDAPSLKRVKIDSGWQEPKVANVFARW